MAFLQEMVSLISQIFMKFWDLPIGDLGFNFGEFFVFTVLVKFALSVFANVSFQPVSTRQGLSKVAEKSKNGAKSVAKKIVGKKSKE